MDTRLNLDMTDIDALLQGSIDMHIHAGPDTLPYRVDAIESARQAKQAGMRAIVLKNHYFPTILLAIIANRIVPEVQVFGSICLNHEMGGLNSYAVEASCKLGAKVLWMPTLSAANSRVKISNTFGIKLDGEGYSILDGNGRLVPEIGKILSLVKQYDMVLASGHMSPEEIFVLVDDAKKMGITKILITHANSLEVVDRALSLEQLQLLVEYGAFIEYVGVNLLPNSFRHNPADMVNAIKTIGANHFIISTDMGPATDPPPSEGMRISIATLLSRGLGNKEIELMIKTNPAKLLGM